jgi:DNA-binding response OmpR family regulator
MFWLSENRNGRLFLLGCPLELTPREYGVLMSVIRHYPGSASVKDICRDNEGLGPGSVPVHITAINKKAARIGGRKLIIAKRGLGYIINRYM